MSNAQSGQGPLGEENTSASVRGIILEHFTAELAYKDGELEQIEDRIRLAKLMLQRLRLGVLAQHYGAAGFYPSELDYSKENIGVQGAWETFESDALEVKQEEPEVNEDELDLLDCEEKDSDPPLEDNSLTTLDKVCMNDEAVGWTTDHVMLKQEPDELCPLLSTPTNHLPDMLDAGLGQPVVSTLDGAQPVVSTLDGAQSVYTDHVHCQPASPCDQDTPSRFYHKKRIIVGNTSQYLDPSSVSSGNGSTHKWMVYVRGSRDEPDISNFVNAVRFFLHPSYHPHDIILISKPPFHLTKLGWGEFPVRMQLEFVDGCNKPVDIIHNLVLDRTHTGRQTLGAETVVDLDLTKVKDQFSMDSINGCAPNGVNQSLMNGLDGEFCVSNVEEIMTAHSSVQQPMHWQSPPGSSDPQIITSGDGHHHSTSVDDVILCEENEMDLMDGESVDEHSTAARCCQYQRKSQQSPQIIRHISLPLSAASTDFIYLDHDYCSSSVVTVTSVLPHCSPPPHKHSTSTSPERYVTDCESGKSVTTSNNQPLTSNLDKCLHAAVRAIPLCGRVSLVEGFLLCANSLSQFLSWSVGRRRAAEWMRAIAVKQYVARQLKINDVMTTKQVVEWCRRNGYTPLDSNQPGSEPGFCKHCGCQMDDIPQDMGMANREHNVEKSDGHRSCAEGLKESDTGGSGRQLAQMLTEPYSCFSEVLALHDQINYKEKLREQLEQVDVLSVESSQRTSNPADDESLPRYRVPQTPELKWIQQTSAAIGIRVYPAVIDRMYAHVVEHMIYMSCARFLRSILMQTLQESGNLIEGESSRERVLLPRHILLAVNNLQSCDFLTGKYMGLEVDSEFSDSDSSNDSDSD